jgi:hypothetical protein
MGHVAFVSLMLRSAQFVTFCTHTYISLYTFMPTRPAILSRHFNYEGLYSSHYRYVIYICVYEEMSDQLQKSYKIKLWPWKLV